MDLEYNELINQWRCKDKKVYYIHAVHLKTKDIIGIATIDPEIIDLLYNLGCPFKLLSKRRFELLVKRYARSK